MKKLLFTLLPIILLISYSCSSIETTTRYEEEGSPPDTTQTLETVVIVNELLESARQDYMEAIYSQDLGFKEEALISYNSALRTINRLSYYPEIDQNEAFIELENSIVEDYRSLVNGMEELPENLSISALDEWMTKNLYDNPAYEEDDFNEEVVTKDIIIIGDFPLEVNRYVEKYIEYFTGRGRPYMEKWISRSGKYFPMMIRIFTEEQVPHQLIFLSMPESGLNPRARSWAKAVGFGKIYYWDPEDNKEYTIDLGEREGTNKNIIPYDKFHHKSQLDSFLHEKFEYNRTQMMSDYTAKRIVNLYFFNNLGAIIDKQSK